MKNHNKSISITNTGVKWTAITELSLSSTDEAEDPAAVPMVWISKWVDYSDKYGFGYQLSDDTIGVIFNDLTKLLLLVDGKWVFLSSFNQSHLFFLDRHNNSLSIRI